MVNVNAEVVLPEDRVAERGVIVQLMPEAGVQVKLTAPLKPLIE